MRATLLLTVVVLLICQVHGYPGQAVNNVEPVNTHTTSSIIHETKCARGAVLIDDECECPVGTSGIAEVCCLPVNHVVCSIREGPILRNFAGQDMIITALCPSALLSSMEDTVISCHEVVIVEGGYQKNGLSSYDSVKVSGRYGDFNNGFVNFIIVLDELGVIYMKGNYVDTLTHRGTHTIVDGHVTVSIDGDGRYTYRGCSVDVRYYKGDATKGGRPGLCMTKKTEVSSAFEFTDFCDPVAEGNNFTSYGAFLLARQLRSYAQWIHGTEQATATCDYLVDMRGTCHTNWATAVDKCALILTHPVISLCIDAKGLELDRYFMSCVQLFCYIDLHDACKYLEKLDTQKCIPDIDLAACHQRIPRE